MHDRAAPDTRLPNCLPASGLELAGQKYLRQLLRAARAGDPAEVAEDAAATASAAEQILVLAQGAA